MNNFEKELVEMALRELPADASVVEVFEWLAKQKLIDSTNTRTLTIKSFVWRLLTDKRKHYRKLDAFAVAADHFGCSDYMVRNYYYK